MLRAMLVCRCVLLLLSTGLAQSNVEHVISTKHQLHAVMAFGFAGQQGALSGLDRGPSGAACWEEVYQCILLVKSECAFGHRARYK